MPPIYYTLTFIPASSSTVRRSIMMLAALLSASGCAAISSPQRAECEIAPPTGSIVQRQITQKVGLDLSAFVKAPVKGSFENDLKDKVDQAYQMLNERNTACYMLLSTVSCLSKQPDSHILAAQLNDYLTTSKQCDGTATPQQATTPTDDLSGDWVGISNQLDNAELPAERPVDLANARHRITEDVVHLTFKDGVVSGISEGQGLRWENSGYLRDGVLVLAYRTAGPHGRGFGTHLMMNQDGYGKVYVGYVEGRECVINQIVKYPYILVKGKPGSKEVDLVKRQYANVLNQHGVTVNPLICK